MEHRSFFSCLTGSASKLLVVHHPNQAEWCAWAEQCPLDSEIFLRLNSGGAKFYSNPWDLEEEATSLK